MPISAGVVIAGRYKIARLLGEGGFGAVYLAEDIRLGNKRVAVKESFSTSKEAQDQFRLEAELLANLQHAGLPRVTDHFLEADGRQFLVMDFIEGDDLDQRVGGAGCGMGEREAAAVMLQVCDAVAYLHTRRPQPVIHRDIKPPNIKITRDNRAMLVDFGIAKLYTPGKKTVKVAKAVTPHFSPPEQYIGKTDSRSDVYALGATFYYLVCGQPPVDAMDRLSTGAEIVPPSRLNGQVSQAVERIILQALDLDPDQRFQNANHMSAALRGYLMGQPAPAPALAAGGAVCRVCGRPNRPGARFCSRDGAPLQAAGSPPALETVEPEMLFEIANAYARRDDFAQALPRYETCLQRGYTDPAVYHNLGLTYINMDRLHDATAILERGASRYPQDADIQFQLARAWLLLDEPNRALGCAARACQLAPNDAVNHFLYGQLLFDVKRYQEAIRSLERSSQIDENPRVFILMGRAYAGAGDLKRAISVLRRAAQVDPKSAEPHFWLGVCLLDAKKHREAIAAVEDALRLEPQAAISHYLLGNVHLDQDQYSQALKCYQEAARLDPKVANFHAHIGLCYALLHRSHEARSALQKALALDPNHSLALELLQKI